MFEAAIFDFDETIVNLEQQHTAAAAGLCQARGADYHAMPPEFRHRSGHRIIDDIREIRDWFGWTEPLEKLSEERERYFAEACRTSPVAIMPNAIETIRVLQQRGLKLAIASSGVRPSIEEMLVQLGIAGAFSAVVGGEDVEHGKPDPEPYLKAAALLGVRPERCLAIEDSALGVRAAKAAGMFCVAVRNPAARTRQDLTPADVELQSLAEFDFEKILS